MIIILVFFISFCRWRRGKRSRWLRLSHFRWPCWGSSWTHLGRVLWTFGRTSRSPWRLGCACRLLFFVWLGSSQLRFWVCWAVSFRFRVRSSRRLLWFGWFGSGWVLDSCISASGSRYSVLCCLGCRNSPSIKNISSNHIDHLKNDIHFIHQHISYTLQLSFKVLTIENFHEGNYKVDFIYNEKIRWRDLF